jgi:CubicO group peptidase (beta-lactamase class C family)
MSTYKQPVEFYNHDVMRGLIKHDDTTDTLEDTSSDATDTGRCPDGSCPNDDVHHDTSIATTTVTPPAHLNINCLVSILDSEFSQASMITNQSRAIVISYDGKIVTERYQSQLGITSDTKLLGWSMTKSVFSVIVGTAIQQGLLTLDTPVQLKHLKPDQKAMIIETNNGKDITFRHLLQMYDILGFVEDYGIMKDVAFMLYGTYETVKFATTRPSYPDSNRIPGDGWYYSSAVSNLLSEELRHVFPTDKEYWAFPHKHLFAKIDANSFAIELDARGTFVASSFGFAVS